MSKKVNDNLSDSGRRLIMRLAEIGLKQPEFIAQMDKYLGQNKHQNFNNWKNRGVPRRAIQDAAKAIGVTSQWLEHGELPKIPESHALPNERDYNNLPYEIKDLFDEILALDDTRFSAVSLIVTLLAETTDDVAAEQLAKLGKVLKSGGKGA